MLCYYLTYLWTKCQQSMYYSLMAESFFLHGNDTGDEKERWRDKNRNGWHFLTLVYSLFEYHLIVACYVVSHTMSYRHMDTKSVLFLHLFPFIHSTRWRHCQNGWKTLGFSSRQKFHEIRNPQYIYLPIHLWKMCFDFSITLTTYIRNL